jgi:hypothetical protein
MSPLTQLRLLIPAALMAITLMTAPAAAAEQPREILYVPFETNTEAVVARGLPKAISARVDAYEKGVVGQAARSSKKYNGIRYDARGNIDMDRGSMAFFFKFNGGDVGLNAWTGIAGMGAMDVEGYWGSVMEFHQIAETFHLQFFDVGRYTQRLEYEPVVGRWKKGQWIHLAAVWDRDQGMTIYEDGKRIASNWGRYRWDWNYSPRVLFLGRQAKSSLDFSVDELHVYADCLTDAQITELAAGRQPAGAGLPVRPDAQRHAQDLERMGWTDADLDGLPVLPADQPVQITFASILRAFDAKRQVAQPFEGLKDSTWPLAKYGSQLSGRRLELEFAPSVSFDRVRLFAQRPLKGSLTQPGADTEAEPLLLVDARRPIWRGRFPSLRTDRRLQLLRETGMLGQIDFYRVETPEPALLKAETVEFQAATPLAQAATTPAGRVLLGETPVRFDNAFRAVQASAPAGEVSSPAMGGIQILTEPITASTPLQALTLTLVTRGLTKPTPVQIVVKEPVWPQRDWFACEALLKPSGSGEDRFILTLKGRPVLTPIPETKVGNLQQPVTELAVLITAADPVTWRLGKGGVGVTLVKGDLAAIRPVAVADQIEFAREAFSHSMEGHIWDGGHAMEQWGRLAWPLLYLQGVAPDERAVMQLQIRTNWRNTPVPYAEPKNELGAPEWAFWQMQALAANKAVVHWIIDHRQLPNGEFGGVYGDDTDLVENWIDMSLMGDDDRKIGDALRRIYKGLWENNLVEGVSASIRDHVHSYEEGMGTISQRLLLDYGNPTAVERVMAASGHYSKWMKLNEDGSYSFRSWYWGVSGVWEDGAFGQDTPRNALALIPAAYLAWYNRHPAPLPYLTKWKLALSDVGIVADTLYELKSEPEKAAFRDDWYAKQVTLSYQSRASSLCVNAILDEVPLRPEWIAGLQRTGRKAAVVPNTSSYAIHMGEGFNLMYRVTGDLAWLVNGYKATCQLLNNLDWTYTVAQPSTDRIAIPHTTLSRARLGAMAGNRGANGNFWPRHGISYTAGADDVAALVTTNTTAALTVQFWSFAATNKPLSARVWRLWPGEYEISLAQLPGTDGRPGATLSKERRRLERGAPLTLSLPPRTGVVLEIKALTNQPPVFDLPDPAIGLEDVKVEYASGHLQVTVHNIGTQPASNVMVRVTDTFGGRIIAEQLIPRIEAPLDLKPRSVRLEFHNVDCVTRNRLRVELVAKEGAADLNPFNNIVDYEY